MSYVDNLELQPATTAVGAGEVAKDTPIMNFLKLPLHQHFLIF